MLETPKQADAPTDQDTSAAQEGHDMAVGVETLNLTMKFGTFTALNNVSIKIEPGSFHALLGENGAGKSTLVKCVMGFHQPTSGQVMVDDKEVEITHPRIAHEHGLGMVYQHFTLVPSLTAAENLVVSQSASNNVISWKKAKDELSAFMARMPFSVPLDVSVHRLAAGEKQKLELLKQLFLGRRFLVLDEPTSVLTPAEADELLGMVRELCQAGTLTCLMITHKFREVTQFADHVSVLRHGDYVGGGKVGEISTDEMANLMIGEKELAPSADRVPIAEPQTLLRVTDVKANDRSGLKPIAIDDLEVKSGEVVGIAGISGNGQMELMEILAGQRPILQGKMEVRGEAFSATRKECKKQRVRYLPEEPLRNASAPQMSVAENIAFRTFDDGSNPASGKLWLDMREMRAFARELVAAFKVKTTSIEAPISSLSGGNVQRAILSRELTGDVDLLIVSNPCFGLDFSAVSEIRARIMAARNQGAAVLLLSEDLDEILELSDRVLVMSEGRIAFETPIEAADRAELGNYMAGHAV